MSRKRSPVGLSESERLVRRFMDALQSPYVATKLQELITSDFHWHTARGEDVWPRIPGFFDLLWNRTTDGVSFTVHGVVAAADRVAVEAESYVPFDNGTVYNNLYHFLFVLRDGRIEAVREHCDTAHAAQVLGPLLQQHGAGGGPSPFNPEQQ